MEYLDKEFGIVRNESTLRGYYMQSTWWKCWTIGPFTAMAERFHFYFISKHEKKNWEKQYVSEMSLFNKVKRTLSAFTHSFAYGKNLFKGQVINPIINKVRKPKITLNQLKEKYGTLRVYFSAPDYLSEHIEDMVRRTEIKLAVKGAYIPLESFYYAGTSWQCNSEHHPTDYDVAYEKSDKYGDSKTVTVYNYRKAMKDLGLDLKEIKVKADAQNQKREDDSRDADDSTK